jgi:fructoselysine-6-P-deglycase FrlB-like protein
VEDYCCSNWAILKLELADYVIEIPETSDALSPLITTIPLQLLSYHIAVMRECNVDQPKFGEISNGRIRKINSYKKKSMSCFCLKF